MPALAQVPQAPRSLMGLANRRGSVLPVASVRALLGRQETAITQTARLIVLRTASPIALAVDEVINLCRVAGNKVQNAEADVAAEAGEHLSGVFESGAGITKILDVAELLRRGFVQNVPRRQTAAPRAVSKNAATSSTEIFRQRLVTFDVAGQEYAFPLDCVREIFTVPESLTVVPGSDDAVRGVMPYRDGLLPLLSLRRLLSLPSVGFSREKVLIVSVGDVLIGFVADQTRAVLSVDPDRVEPAPAVLAARAGGEMQIREIYRANEGRLVSILAPERLFREDAVRKLTNSETTMKAKAEVASQHAGAAILCFLVFRLDDNEFALPVDAVDEVARVPDQITRLPKTPKFLEGVINLRGDVLPVIDQRRRFDMPATTTGAGRRLVVIRSGAHRAGLIVDSVSEVLRCSPDQIQPSPDLIGEAFGLVHAVINLETSGRIVLLLDPAELLTRTERGLLDSLSKETRGKEIRQTGP